MGNDERVAINFWDLLEKDWAPIKGKLTPNRRMSKEVPCPFCGGSTRFRYRAADDEHGEMVFCSHCATQGLGPVSYIMRRHNLASVEEALAWFTNQSQTKATGPKNKVVIPPERPLDADIALDCHHAPGEWRDYFHGRFISNAAIDRYRLGWKCLWQRYSIPCWQRNPTTQRMELHGIQYRITPEAYARKKAAGEKPLKYVSEEGSHNHRLFNSYRVNRPLSYMLVIEGPLDVITLAEWGRPAVAAFQGNNEAKPWDYEWNRFLHQTDSVLVIPDNDESGVGDRFALRKQEMIPHSRIHRLPPGVKDVGELIRQWSDQGWDADRIQNGLTEWLMGRKPVPDY